MDLTTAHPRQRRLGQRHVAEWRQRLRFPTLPPVTIVVIALLRSTRRTPSGAVTTAIGTRPPGASAPDATNTVGESQFRQTSGVVSTSRSSDIKKKPGLGWTEGAGRADGSSKFDSSTMPGSQCLRVSEEHQSQPVRGRTEQRRPVAAKVMVINSLNLARPPESQRDLDIRSDDRGVVDPDHRRPPAPALDVRRSPTIGSGPAAPRKPFPLGELRHDLARSHADSCAVGLPDRCRPMRPWISVL